jgi:PhoH-like ATPase
MKKPLSRLRQYVLDTNVLINDPLAVFNFDEHNVVICMTVLEELDHIKDSNSQRHAMASREARLAIQNIKRIINGSSSEDVTTGVSIGEGQGVLIIFNDYVSGAKSGLVESVNDNRIISAAIALQESQGPELSTVLVTKDINVHLKSMAAGLEHVEDYRNDQSISDIDYLSSGYMEVPDDFPNRVAMIDAKHQDKKHIFIIPSDELDKYELNFAAQLYPNQYLFNKESVWRVIEIDDEGVVLEHKPVQQMMNKTMFGIRAKSVKQALAIDALMNPEISLVQITGGAGSGKTLLALASALEQTIESRIYNKIIVTRNTPPMTEDIGALPGTEEEKMAPWLAAFSDSLEVLVMPKSQDGNTPDKFGQDDGFLASVEMIKQKSNMQFKSLNFMRGRSINNAIVVIDESQNLTPHQTKSILTRVGKHSKIIFLGNLNQIDAKYVTALSSGLTHSVEKMKPFSVSASVTLEGGERSELASIAEENL